MKKEKRWRANIGETYYCLSADLMVLDICIEETLDWHHKVNDYYYKSGNYFRTKEEAEEVVKKIKKLFKDE